MRRPIIITTAVIVISIISFLIVGKSPEFLGKKNTDLKNNALIIKPKYEPKKLYGYVIDSMQVITSKVKRNQSLSAILENYNIPFQKIITLAKVSKPVFDVRKIRPNRDYILICKKDSLHTAIAMIYEPSPIEYVIFNLGDSVFTEKHIRKIKQVEKSITGRIEMSLAATIDELGGSPQLTNDIVDVLAWQIDFFRLQKGDEFKVIYDEEQVDGKYIGIGTIKGAYFKHFGNDYYAYYFDQGSGIDYFDEEGNSLRKAFLKYPLDFTRISSRYSGRRFHPVQKRWKSHRGTDFAAPRGTPIRTVGDGIVLEARYNKYNGNYVKIKHNATYSTQYLHMSKIAKGMKIGAKVKQGQVIGYVGKTGLATGNHLCYRFWKNGVQIDALKVKLPPSEPIKKENLEAYTIVCDSIRNQLDRIEIAKPINYIELYTDNDSDIKNALLNPVQLNIYPL